MRYRWRVKPQQPAAGCGTRGTPFAWLSSGIHTRPAVITYQQARRCRAAPPATAAQHHPHLAPPFAWCCALALVTPSKQPKAQGRKQEKEHQYFILRNISYLFPTCSQNVPTLFPKLFVAVSALFTRDSRLFHFQKMPCSHVPKKNKVLRHFDAAAAPCPRLHLGTKKPPRWAALLGWWLALLAWA